MGGGAAAIAQIKDANSAADAAGTSGVGKAKSATGITGGAFAGAATGLAKGALGFNTNTAGGKIGGMAADTVKATASKVTKGNENSSTQKKTPNAKEPTLKPGDKGFYHSSVPPQKDFT